MMEGSSSPRQAVVPNHLYVSFSKRRKGLFQKAFELCRKCDAQVAVLVLSPTGNPFAFGHSSVDDVLRRYYLQQQTSTPNNNYCPPPPLLIGNNNVGITKKQRLLAQQVEGLKDRIKQAQNKESCSLRDLKGWIEREWESCRTLEELEFLKQKYLALLESVRNRLMRSTGTTTATGSPNRMSFWMEKRFECQSLREEGNKGGTENYVWDYTHDQYLISTTSTAGFDCKEGIIDSVGMAGDGDDNFLLPHGGGGGDFLGMDQVFRNVRPLDVKEEMYSMEKKFDYYHSSGEEGNGSGNTSTTTVEESFNNCVSDLITHDQCLIGASTGFEYGNVGTGMAGDSFFLPHQNVSGFYGGGGGGGGDCSDADHRVFSDVHPLVVKDMSNSMVRISDDQVLNFHGRQIPSFSLDALKTMDDRKFLAC